MSQPVDTLITGGTLVARKDQAAPLVQEQASIALNKGRIAALGAEADRLPARHHIKATGLHILPGLIDSQVHFREPGLQHKESIRCGTRGALLGGITGVFEMPNTTPSTTTRPAVQQKLSCALKSAYCNYAFFVGSANENIDQLAQLEQLPGVCGVKTFMGSSTGNLLVDDLKVLSAALRAGRRRMSVHCEDQKRLMQRHPLTKKFAGQVHKHPEWRDTQTALTATQNLVTRAIKYQRPVHVLHVSTGNEIEYLQQQKIMLRSRLISVEVTPQHLTLHAPECYDRLQAFAQMNPPIRSRWHQQMLWKGVREGVVDIIGSDHAPHTRAEKRRPWPQSPSGLTGVQTTVPLMLKHIHNKKLNLEALLRLMCENPCRLFGIQNKGRLAPGFDADLSVLDLKAQRRICNSQMATRSGWTPFDGWRVTGWPIMTFVNGQLAMRDAQILSQPGRAFRFW